MIALSYSGETEELVPVLETLKRLGTCLIAITGDREVARWRRRPTSRSTATCRKKPVR